MKYFLLLIAFTSTTFGATVIAFSDSVNVITTAPPTNYVLDSSAYMNGVIGQGSWEVDVSPFSTIGSFDVLHSISLFGSGSLSNVKVYGAAGGTVSLTVNSGLPTEQVFLGTVGSLPDEFVFNLMNYDLGQGGSTLLAGFGSIDTINFSGSYTMVPEPSAVLFSGIAPIILLMRRRRLGVAEQDAAGNRWGVKVFSDF
jgi:hypothetical protein